MSYLNLLKIIPEEVDGLINWVWIASDNGAWDGPRDDWKTSHSQKFFKYIKNNDLVVTAGGNCGLYTRLYANRFKIVYSFEPDPLNFHCMVNNSQLDNVVKMQCALGAECKPVWISRPTMDNVGCHTINDVQPGGMIPMLTLDSFNLPALNFLQLDVEGYEYNALKGSIKTIDKYKPVIAVEVGFTPQRIAVTENIKNLLKELNYDLIDQSISDSIWVPKE